MFDYKSKILKKFRVIELFSWGLNIVFFCIFLYVNYLYANQRLPLITVIISVLGCAIGIVSLLYNRIKYKRKIVDEARQEAQYFSLEKIIEDLKSGKIVCIQKQNDIGFIKQEGMKLLFFTRNAEKLMERTYENGIMYIKNLLNTKNAFFYQNGFLFSIRENEAKSQKDEI